MRPQKCKPGAFKRLALKNLDSINEESLPVRACLSCLFLSVFKGGLLEVYRKDSSNYLEAFGQEFRISKVGPLRDIERHGV